jgi:nucleotide-binding universal stress UspA family protein
VSPRIGVAIGMTWEDENASRCHGPCPIEHRSCDALSAQTLILVKAAVVPARETGAMALRSILLHLDASPASIARLKLTHDLADRCDAEVTVLFGTRGDSSELAFTYSAAAALQAAEEREEPNEIARAQLHAAHCERGNESAWFDVSGDLQHALVAEAAYADLLVVGAPAPAYETGGVPAGLVEAAILRSGTPALVVPSPQRHEALAERVLIAWDGSAPAARAVRAALPLLRPDARVDIVSWSSRPVAAPCSHRGLQAWLRQHGIEAQTHEQPHVPAVGDALSAMALSLRADLVVMGCYGHGVLRERIFGGATRSVLGALPAPVLMAH